MRRYFLQRIWKISIYLDFSLSLLGNLCPTSGSCAIYVITMIPCSRKTSLISIPWFKEKRPTLSHFMDNFSISLWKWPSFLDFSSFSTLPLLKIRWSQFACWSLHPSTLWLNFSPLQKWKECIGRIFGSDCKKTTDLVYVSKMKIIFLNLSTQPK